MFIGLILNSGLFLILGIKTFSTERRLSIQKVFHKQLGLRLYFPKQDGKRNSNDGNTARRVFENADLFSPITGIREDFIYNLKAILIALNSSETISSSDYLEVLKRVFQICQEYYSWYYFPVTVHKILSHEQQAIDFFALPLSNYSEQSLESFEIISKIDAKFR